MRLQSTTAPSRTFTSLLFVIAAFFAFIASFALSGSSAPAGETAESSTPLPGAAQSMPAVGVTVEENHAWDISWRDKVVALEVKGAIVGKPFSDMSDRLTAALDKADQDGAHLVVIEMDSPGGEVGACDKLSKRIFESKTPVVAVVVHKAVSGGAMLASAAREIVMTKSGRIGDIQPMQASITGGGAGMDDRTAEKIEVDIRTIMKVYAEHYGRPVPVVEAMVSRSASLYQVHFDDDSRVFLTGHELEVLEENIQKGRETRHIADTKLIKPEGRLLELSAQEAVEYGLASEVVDSLDAFYQSRSIDADDLVRPNLPEGEISLRKLLPSASDLGLPIWVLVLLGVFLIVGIAGIVTEFQAPGSGIPLAVGIIGFVCFFSVLLMHDRGSPIGIVLFLIGVGLLVVEIMILPGFGSAGILGIVLTLGGLLMAFTPDWNSEYMSKFMWHEVGSFTLLLFLGLAAALAVIWLISAYGERIPIIGRFFLTKSADAGENPNPETLIPITSESARMRYTSLVGKIGVAESMLRPSGKVRLETGELLDVITDGVYVEAGRQVRVVEAAPNRIVVAVVRHDQYPSA